MSEITVFSYSDYREYIEMKLKNKGFGRGGKARLAKFLSCQPSFVSQVLKNKSSFNLEQGFKLNSFFQHNPLAKEYFMVLIELDRAGTLELRNYFEEKRLQLIEKSKLIENQMSYDQLSEPEAIAYYSNWNHILIRNLIDIPEYKKTENLKKKLKLSDQDFEDALKFLVDKKLVYQDSTGKLQQGHTRLHVKKNSPIAKFGNITTRLQTIKLLEKPNYNSINYSSNMTIQKTQFEEFKKKLVTLIADLNDHLEKDSNANMMATLVIDFMEI